MGDAIETDALRARIRELDRALVALAAERVTVARQLGDAKRRAAQPIVDYAQERVVLERARAAAEAAGLDARVAEAILLTLIRAAVSAQDQDSWRHAAVGQGKTAVVVGGEGRMGRWFTRFLADQGYEAGALDIRASGEERAWAEGALANADLVVCSTPPAATAALYERWRPSPPAGIIVDIASIKTPLVDPIRKLQESGAAVASIHPMFGPSVALLRDCDVVICDTGDARATRMVSQLFESTTARLMHVPLAEHDRLMADVLTLAHSSVIAFALALPDAAVPVRSTTLGALQTLSANLVRESPDVYYEIQALNPHSADALNRLARAIDRVRDAVASRDAGAFTDLMREGEAKTTSTMEAVDVQWGTDTLGSSAHAAQMTTTNTTVVKDPVCGMDVDTATAAARSEYQGQTFYFCGAKCKETFVLDPKPYVGASAGTPKSGAGCCG